MKDIEKANRLFDEAYAYEKGKGVLQNFDKAIEKYIEADEYGHDEALCCAGMCCQFKLHDIKRAIDFYNIAISKKNGNACYLLSVC